MKTNLMPSDCLYMYRRTGESNITKFYTYGWLSFGQLECFEENDQNERKQSGFVKLETITSLLYQPVWPKF
jgi:hypothetical protein